MSSASSTDSVDGHEPSAAEKPPVRAYWTLVHWAYRCPTGYRLAHAGSPVRARYRSRSRIAALGLGESDCAARAFAQCQPFIRRSDQDFDPYVEVAVRFDDEEPAARSTWA